MDTWLPPGIGRHSLPDVDRPSPSDPPVVECLALAMLRRALVVLLVFVCGVLGGGLRAVSGTGSFIHVDGGPSSYLFHGVNIVHKGLGEAEISQGEIDTMRAMGFNVVRFGFLWFNVEVAPGVYNETYIASMTRYVNLLWANGFRVILDMHQDCYSAFYCAGADGVPLFYGRPPLESNYFWNGSRAFPLPFLPPKYASPQLPPWLPFGLPESCGELPVWAMCYTTYTLAAATQRLYDDEDGLQGALGRMWQRVAGAFAGHPAIVGYELMNEPWLGKVPLNLNELDPITNPRFYNLWNSGVADRVNLAPLYERVAGMIRAVDNDTAIFFEPASGGSLIDTRVGFSTGPGGSAADAAGLNVLSYHEYCPLIQSDVPIPQNSTNPIWQWAWTELTLDICRSIGHSQFLDRQADVDRLGVGGFVTEFGAIPHSAAGAQDMVRTLDQIDRIMHSWTFWAIRDVYLAPAFIRASLTRSFPWAVVGKLDRFSTADLLNNGSLFVTRYTLPAVLPSPPTGALVTLIFLSPFRFGTVIDRDFSVTTSPPCCLQVRSFNATTGLLTVSHDFGRLLPSMLVEVRIQSNRSHGTDQW